ncbi:MAG TPA: hypothetical protein VGM91_15365 [Conexibacter sp.]|jgi:hypothetical protein
MRWQINPHDDFPFHQAAQPIDVPVQSDRHFNDGYWFSFYTAGTYAFCGLRLHPNSNVIDGYAGAIHGGVQRNVRFSRALRPRTNDLAVGPFRLEIIEPMRRQRLVLGPNDSGVELDVEVSVRAVWPESRHLQHRHGVVLNDLLRYTGVTRVRGWLSIDGERIAVDDWHGARDHSWGIRASMGPRTPLGGVVAEPRDPRALRIWIPFECGDELGFFHMHEDADGNVLDFEGEIVAPDGSVTELAAARHAFVYEPGSRRVSSGAFTLVEQGGAERDYAFEIVCEPAHPQGFGYTFGWSDGGNPGVWRGAEAIEADRWDVTDPTKAPGGDHLPPARRLGGTEFAATLRGPGDTAGMAHVEHMVYGTYKPYGFDGPVVWG